MASFLDPSDEIPAGELQDTISRLNNMGSDKDRMRLLKMTVRNFTFTCEQGKQLLNVCQFSSTGIEACLLVHERCHDKEANWKALLGAFKYEDEIAELTLRMGSNLSVGDEDEGKLAPDLKVVAGKTVVATEDPRFLQRKKKEEEKRLANLATVSAVASENAAQQGIEQVRLETTHAAVITHVEVAQAATEGRHGGGAGGGEAGKKEEALSDEQFLSTFSLTKEKFRALPQWKQQNLKKQHGLF